MLENKGSAKDNVCSTTRNILFDSDSMKAFKNNNNKSIQILYTGVVPGWWHSQTVKKIKNTIKP